MPKKVLDTQIYVCKGKSMPSNEMVPMHLNIKIWMDGRWTDVHRGQRPRQEETIFTPIMDI
jgi:hypothetical protein